MTPLKLKRLGNFPPDKQYLYQNYYLNKIYAMNTYAFRDVSLPGGTTETEYVNGQQTVVKTTGCAYNLQGGKPVSFTPSSVSETGSNGEVYTKTTFV